MNADESKKPVWQKAFLAALENMGSVTQAAEAANIGRSNVYKHRRNDAQFAREWDEAMELGADALEDEARRRAFDGSDLLIIFLLKSIRPHKYRETRATVPPDELNRMIEAEFEKRSRVKARGPMESESDQADRTM